MISAKREKKMNSYKNRIMLNNLPAMDISIMKRFGCFSVGKTSYWTCSNGSSSAQLAIELSVKRIRIIYNVYDPSEKESKSFDYYIYIEKTGCYYGGYRWWLLCPCYKNGTICGRRVRKLYMHNSLFGCRYCHNLCYSIQNENHRSIPNRIYRVVVYENRAIDALSKVKHQTYNGVLTKNMGKYYKYMGLKNKYVEEGIDLLKGIRDEV